MTGESIADQVRKTEFKVCNSRPFLLFDHARVTGIQQRFKEESGAVEGAGMEMASILARDPRRVDELQAYIDSNLAVRAAELRLLTGRGDLDEWLKARVDALLSMETWFCHVHKGCIRICDHVMCNLAAHVSLVHDLAPDLFDEQAISHMAERLQVLLLDPFLSGTEEPTEWWYGPNVASNWKIMCCGEAGLALCSFSGRLRGAREGIARAARGVWEVLDLVPAEGDWGEGPGYWFHTLWMGLRFAMALRRLTDGEIDLFAHPALKTTGDFLTQLTTPAGRVYNFSDCNAPFSRDMGEAITVLAEVQNRADWRYVSRFSPYMTPLILAYNDADAEVEPSPLNLAAFPTNGLATMRTGWGDDDLFVGFRSGPSNVGHSHLDANSFVVEACGVPLVNEYEYWPQAHFLGFFDSNGPRWNFDGPGTVGHSTLLVDGKGQTCGADYPGRLLYAKALQSGWVVAGDASLAYPGLLRKYIRTVLLLPADVIVVRDVIECEGDHHLEWLIQYAGTIESEGLVSIIKNGGTEMTVVPFLPDREMGWRWSDVTRNSHYQHSDSLEMVTRAVQYRSFSTFRAHQQTEFLFGFRVGGTAKDEWRFAQEERGSWRLTVPGKLGCVVPDGDGLAID